jgi:hypothetical protein
MPDSLRDTLPRRRGGSFADGLDLQATMEFLAMLLSISFP